MDHTDTTCWTMIRGAADGDAYARADFARRYGDAVRAYLIARWRKSALLAELEDAVQEVFVECFREGGVLDKADADRPGGFRAFFYGVARNVALRIETRTARHHARAPAGDSALVQAPSEDDQLSQVFDRAWAQALMQQAADMQIEQAAQLGPEARRRVELLQLRFRDGLPIRDIAARWGIDAAHLHREYAKARKEFKDALLELMRFHHPDGQNLDQECRDLLALLE